MENDPLLPKRQKLMDQAERVRIEPWSARRRGEVPEWPKGADCKSAGNAFEGSNPSLSTILFCGNSSVGRARAFQARGRGFESRFPLQFVYG